MITRTRHFIYFWMHTRLQMLCQVVATVENPASVQQKLSALGPLHNSKGVKVEHTVHMGASLFFALEKVLATDFLAEVCIANTSSRLQAPDSYSHAWMQSVNLFLCACNRRCKQRGSGFGRC